MTILSLFGCGFIAYGPALAIFILTVAPNAQQVLVFICSAFFWLVSLLVSSLFWKVISYGTEHLVYSLILSVLFQELFRYFFWVLIKRAEAGLLIMANAGNSPLQRLYYHFVSSLGFGVMSGLFSMANLLASIVGPGTIALNGGSQYFPVISAFLTNGTILNHIFWGIVFFDSMETRNYRNTALVVCSHLLVSVLTLLNIQQIFWPSLTCSYSMMTVMGIWSFHLVGGSVGTLKRSLVINRRVQSQ